MKIKEILSVKGSSVCSIKSNQTIQEAVHQLAINHVGALLVTDAGNGQIVGILSERDVIRGCNVVWKPLLSVRVGEWMTRKVLTCAPEDEVRDVMQLMTEKRIRHVPVSVEGEMVGIISIGDVVKALLEENGAQIQYLTEYAFGVTEAAV